MTPNQLTSYVRRDSGTTATGDYPYWLEVVSTDKAARFWNRMTYAFRHDCPTEKRFDWYAAHFSRVIEEQFAGHDRTLLGQKLLAHVQGDNR